MHVLKFRAETLVVGGEIRTSGVSVGLRAFQTSRKWFAQFLSFLESNLAFLHLFLPGDLPSFSAYKISFIEKRIFALENIKIVLNFSECIFLY